MISIIVPVYNVEKFLVQCLDSIFNQPYYHSVIHEVICINDGSSDNSFSILKEYSIKFSNLVLINQRNKGLGASRNLGIKKSSGKFLLFLDSDDWFVENSFFHFYNLLNLNNNFDFIEFKTQVFHDSNSLISEYNPSNFCLQGPQSGELFLSSSPKILLTAWSKLWNRNFVVSNKLLFSEGVYFEDVKFSISAYLFAKNAFFINEVIYSYRLREGSITKNKVSKKLLTDFYTYRIFYLHNIVTKFSLKLSKSKIKDEISSALFRSFYFLFRYDCFDTFFIKKMLISFKFIFIYWKSFFHFVITKIYNRLSS